MHGGQPSVDCLHSFAFGALDAVAFDAVGLQQQVAAQGAVALMHLAVQY